MVQLVLTPALALENLRDRVVVTSPLAWHWLILPKAYVHQLKSATSASFMDLLGPFGSWSGLSSLHQQNLQQGCQGWLGSSAYAGCWGSVNVSSTAMFYGV